MTDKPVTHLPRRFRPGVVREDRAGRTLRCLVLAAGRTEWAAVDIDTGALVRLREGAPSYWGPGAPSLSVLDVVALQLEEDTDPPDPARPEAVVARVPPEFLGRLRPRRARRLLSQLVPRPTARPLLGVIGPSASIADLGETGPSAVLVHPERGPDVVATGPGLASAASTTWCSFRLEGADERLPLLDERAAQAANAIPGTVLGKEGIAAMIGHDPYYLLIGFAPPVGGHSRKSVLAILPRA